MSLDKGTFMATAIDLAAAALEKGELPIAAVVALDGEVIAQAHASEVTDGRFLVHAELLALLEFDQLKLSVDQRRESALFSTLEPCMMCLGACQSSFVGHVYYALESPIDGAGEVAARLQGERQNYPRQNCPTVSGGMLRDESLALFETYISKHSSGAMWRWAKALVEGLPA